VPAIKSNQPPVETPVLLEAVNVTLRAMERRLRLYRNILVCVSLGLSGSALVALIFRKWIILGGGVLAVPLLVGCFLYLDARAVRAWRDRVLQMQDKGGLDVDQLKKTLTSMRYIPDATLHSMFAMLSSEAPKS